MSLTVDTPQDARQAAQRVLQAASGRGSRAESAKQSTAAGEFLTFRLGGEEYGIDILRVQEIRSYEAPTRIANAPAFLKGVVNLRGVIVPIIDLRLKLGCDRAGSKLKCDIATAVRCRPNGNQILASDRS